MINENKKRFSNNRDRYKKYENYEEIIENLKKRSQKKDLESVEINPLDDWIFKQTFAVKGSEEILKSLANAIFADKGFSKIEHLEILESTKKTTQVLGGRSYELDARAKGQLQDDEKIAINFEAQNYDEPALSDRFVSYCEVSSVGYLEEGESFLQRPYNIQANILNFNKNKYPEMKKSYHSTAHIIFDDFPRRYSNKFRVHDIELPKLINHHIINLKDPLQAFMLFLHPRTSYPTIRKIKKLHPGVKMAEQRMEITLQNTEDLIHYYDTKIEEMRIKTIMQYAKEVEEGKKLAEKAAKEAKELAEKNAKEAKKAVKEAAKEAAEKAKIEKIETVKKLNNKKFPLSEISYLTNLSIEDVEKILTGKK